MDKTLREEIERIVRNYAPPVVGELILSAITEALPKERDWIGYDACLSEIKEILK